MLSLLGVIHLECLGVFSGRAWSSCQSVLNSRISARGATQAALYPGRRDPPLVGSRLLIRQISIVLSLCTLDNGFL